MQLHKDSTRHEPTWESLKRYSLPQWFRERKLGIFLHWGIYCVPAFANVWYPRKDGDQEFPTICGTGTEDYFDGSWGWDVNGQYTTYTKPFLGVYQVIRRDGT